MVSGDPQCCAFWHLMGLTQAMHVMCKVSWEHRLPHVGAQGEAETHAAPRSSGLAPVQGINGRHSLCCLSGGTNQVVL